MNRWRRSHALAESTERKKIRLQNAGGLDDGVGDAVRIDVGSWTPVLEVTIALSSDVSWDTDGCATVRHAGGEAADVSGLVPSSQPEIVVLPVHSDVLVVPLRELLDGGFDVLHASGLAHLLGGEVGVASGTVPVTGERFRVEGDLDAPFFGHTDEEEASHPEVIAHVDALAGTDLELPLRGHDLGVDTRDGHAGVEAGAVVGLDEIAGEDLASAYFGKESVGVRSKWRNTWTA